MKNIAGVDLNLMTAFEAMMIEGSVTRAAARIGLAQPSMSNALARLRTLFDDPLFERAAQGMLPTEKARLLAPMICGALDSLRKAVNDGGRFDPASSEASFRLATTDYGEMIVLPALLSRIRAFAPKVRVQSLPFDRASFVEQLERDGIDAGLTVIGRKSPRMAIEPQFKERFVCIARRGHPAFPADKPLDMDTFVGLDHALVSRGGPPSGAVDRALAAIGRERRIAITVANFTTLMFLVAQSDFVAAVAERLARHMAGLIDLSLHALPLRVDPFTMSMAWHRRTDADAGQLWFRDQVRAVTAGLSA